MTPDSNLGRASEHAMSAVLADFEEWTLRRKMVDLGQWSSLPSAVVALETKTRAAAIDELARTAAREYSQKEREIQIRDEERQKALVDIVGFLGLPATPAAIPGSVGLLPTVLNHLNSVISHSLHGAPKFTIWIVAGSELRMLRETDGELLPAHPVPELVVAAQTRGVPIYEPTSRRHEDDSLESVAAPSPAATMPLRMGADVIGVLSAQFHGAYAIAPGDRQYLEMVATQVAVAVVAEALAREVGDRRVTHAREQLAHLVLHKSGNAASNVAANTEILLSILRDQRVTFVDDLELDVESIIADILVDAELLRQTMDELRTDALKVQTFDIVAEIRDLATQIENDFGVLVIVRGLPKLDVLTVRSLLRHALDNLLRNSAQALDTESRKQVPIDVFISVRSEPSGAVVVVDISDGGRGIEEDQSAAIWTKGRYFRPKGHGYGLSLAREVFEDAGGGVELVNGHCSLGGAHFRAWLPAPDEADPSRCP